MKSIIQIGLIVILWAIGTSLHAQTYTGKVKDASGQAVPFANVVLYALPDSTFVEGVITNDDGAFELNNKSDKPVYIKINSIGYQSQTVSAQSDLNAIVLQASTAMLGEVEVKGKMPRMQLKNDALVANVQNSVLAKEGSANNVLQRLPMLEGEDGKYTVFGKGQAKIYINNREVRDVSELDNLSSEDMKNVEIVSNPGARYDASVKAVIRIRTLKPVGEGFSFNVRSSYFQYQEADWQEQLNMNYRKKGWDFFGSVAYRNMHHLSKTTLDQVVTVDTLWRQHNELYATAKAEELSAVAGVNYEISPKHFAGVKYTYESNLYSAGNSSADNIIYANDKLYDVWTTQGTITNKTLPKHIFNAYYTGAVGKLDINFDATYYTNKEASMSVNKEHSQYKPSQTIKTSSELDNSLLASKLVASYPVFNGRFSFGSEYASTNREDAYKANKIVPSSTTRIEQQSNSFFLEYAKPIWRGQLSAGLRYERVANDYFVDDKFVALQSKTYKQWFPSVSYSTRIKSVGLQLSYAMKTDRPPYSRLSNNVSYINRFTMQSGNPFLKPSITSDITAVFSWKFFQLMTSYSDKKDYIIYWTEQLEDKPSVTMIKYKNLNRLPQFVAFLNVSPTIGIWSPQLSLGVVKQWLELETGNTIEKLNKPLPIIKMGNSFRLPKQFIVTCDAAYRGKGNAENLYMGNDVLQINAGISKSFFNNQLRITARGHDIFNGNNDEVFLYNDKMQMNTKNTRYSQKFELTVRYKFNTAKSKYKGKGAGASEIDRL